MKNLLSISSEEKQRILEMYDVPSSKNNLNEQGNAIPQTTPTSELKPREIEGYTTGKVFVMLPGITNPAQLDAFTNFNDLQANLKNYLPTIPPKPKFNEADPTAQSKSPYSIIANLFNDGLLYIAKTGKNTQGLCTWGDSQSKAILDNVANANYKQTSQTIKYFTDNNTLYPAFTKLVKNRINTIYDCSTKQPKLV